FVPFGFLLSRPLKRDPRRLAFVGLLILFIHYIDIFWLAMPALDEKGVVLRWSHFTAFFGVGLVAIAFALWRLRGRFAVPVKDPYLAESLRYRQPQSTTTARPPATGPSRTATATTPATPSPSAR